jgi:hypothetical protein
MLYRHSIAVVLWPLTSIVFPNKEVLTDLPVRRTVVFEDRALPLSHLRGLRPDFFFVRVDPSIEVLLIETPAAIKPHLPQPITVVRRQLLLWIDDNYFS